MNDERAEPGGAGIIDIRGRTALVTGGSRGVGRATALLLARCGASVGIGYHRRAEEASDTVRSIESFGVRAWARKGDLSRPQDVETLFRQAEDEFGGLDIVVANAGLWPPEDVPVGEMALERWRRTVAVNLDGAFLTVRAAVPLLREEGSLVILSSTAGQRGEAFHADYAATKGGVIALVKSLSGELAPEGIRVNAVAPGWVDTEMAHPAFEEGGLDRIRSGIPLRRVATAEDVAGPVVFLASPLARHITGEVLNVNGGAVLAG